MRESNVITVFLPTDGDPEFLWGHTPSIADPLNPFYDPKDDSAIDIFDSLYHNLDRILRLCQFDESLL